MASIEAGLPFGTSCLLHPHLGGRSVDGDGLVGDMDDDGGRADRLAQDVDLLGRDQLVDFA